MATISGFTVSTTSTTTGQMVWAAWNNLTTATADAATAMNNITMTDVVWQEWNATGSAMSYDIRRAQPTPIGPQQQREIDSRVQRERELAKQRSGLFKQAKARALELLKQVIPADAWFKGDIRVTGDSGQNYLIRTNHGSGIHGNIYKMCPSWQHRVVSICVAPNVNYTHPTYRERAEAQARGEITTIPNEDAILGQYLALKFEEDTLLARGNLGTRQSQCQCRQDGKPASGVREDTRLPEMLAA